MGIPNAVATFSLPRTMLTVFCPAKTFPSGTIYSAKHIEYKIKRIAVSIDYILY
jgi:hypothetical protein